MQQQGYGQRPQLQQYWPQANIAPAPKKKNTLGVVLLAVIVVVLIGAFGIVSSHFVSSASNPVTPPTTPSAGPTTTSGPNSTPVSRPPSVAVPDPEFDPPDLPVPASLNEAIQWLQQNALYSQSAARNDCAVGTIDIARASTAQLEAHFYDLSSCLWQVWNPPLTEAGFQLPRMPITVYDKPITSACGEAPMQNAFYCGADQRIFYAKDFYTVVPRELIGKPFVADSIIAHEFGHGIQARTGVLYARIIYKNQLDDESEELELSRRHEMQADCLAGVFSRSVAAANSLSADELYALAEVIYSVGDDQLTGDETYVSDHGTGNARNRWFIEGVNSYDVGVCNTYIADSSLVR
ncbi:MAG: neutral zinc metallopeptidase [Propionibacteriaceae bacterium]|nr:neutral zinc metallopeptidase [Propionibacteriaceae bacterium]